MSANPLPAEWAERYISRLRARRYGRRERITCPSCGREIALTTRGQISVHVDPAGHGCPASWTITPIKPEPARELARQVKEQLYDYGPATMHTLSPTSDPSNPRYLRRVYTDPAPRGLRPPSAAFEHDPRCR